MKSQLLKIQKLALRVNPRKNLNFVKEVFEVEGIPEEGETREVAAVFEVVETEVEVEETAGNAVDLREAGIGMMAKVARKSLDQVIVVV